MSDLKNGFFVSHAGLVWAIVNGSANQVRPAGPLMDLEPGYFDSGLQPVEPMGAQDEWNESDHDRASDGKFGSGGTSSGSGSSTAKKPSSSSTSSGSGGSRSSTASKGKGSTRAPSSKSAKLNISKLKKSGGKLGSNEGGVYTDDAGGKFYVKKPSSKAHVANEMAASRLYQLAGVNTLNYRDAGPDHVATEWQQLDKNNINKFSAEEKKAAAADFAVHAWLSNWDAAGLGGDNQGIMGGKPTTLDVGGSLRYRAQGGPKGAAFGHKVTELDTLRDKGMNPDAAGLFGSMTDAEIKTSIERVTSIPDDKIRAAVGDDKELADTLIARKQNMAKRFGTVAQDEAMALLAALEEEVEDEDDSDHAGDTSDEAMMAAALDSADDDQDEDAGEPTEVAPDVFAMDEGQFDESLHPRSADGKFGSGGGGAAKKDGESAAIAKVFASKKEHIGHLLTQGTTPKDLMVAMGWPSVSMPAQAKSLGMKLEKKDGKYYGTPMTDAEKAAAKAEEKGKQTDKAAQQILKNAAMSQKTTPETLLGSPAGQQKKEPPASTPLDIPAGPKPGEPPQDYSQFLGAVAEAAQTKDVYAIAGLFKYNEAWAKQFLSTATPKGKEALEKIAPGVFDDYQTKPAPQATADELKKAAKSTTVPISSSAPDGVMLIKDFNDKYAGKDGLSKEQLNQKVQDFKDLKTGIAKADVDYAAKSAAEKKANEKAALEAAQKKMADKLAKEKAELQAEFDKDPDLKVHYEAMEALFGGKSAGKDFEKQSASKVKSAGLTKYMSGADAMPIIAYSGSHYRGVNKELRAGKMTEAQDKFRQSLNAGLDKLPSYSNVTYRKASLNAEQSAHYEVGYVIEERGFMSTSKNQGTWSGDHNFTVHGKNGKDIQKLSSHPSEAEVLFKSGSRFKVVSRKGNDIVLQEV